MQVSSHELAAIAEVIAITALDDSNSTARLEVAAKAAGILDANGFFYQSDEDFLAEVTYRGLTADLAASDVVLQRAA
jgi:hypothetical protein